MPPMQGDRRLETARQLVGAGQWQQAEAICRQILAERPADEQAAYLLGLIALQTKRWELAAQWIGHAIALNPNAPEYHGNIAHALRAMGRIDAAADALERAIALRPDYVLAH